MFMLLMLIFAVLGGVGLMGVERALHRSESVPAIEPVKDELDWLDEDWGDVNYVSMIHRTRELEQDNFGYTVTVCLCNGCNAERERSEFVGVDIAKVNAATLSQKLVTYKTYYNSADDPNVKPIGVLGYDRVRDHLGREMITNLRVPPAIWTTNESRSVRDKFVPDTYSEKMRLKEEIAVTTARINDLATQIDFYKGGRGYVQMSDKSYKEYRRLTEQLRDLRQASARRSVRRGGEIDEYIIEDGSGREIKRWKHRTTSTGPW